MGKGMKRGVMEGHLEDLVQDGAADGGALKVCHEVHNAHGSGVVDGLQHPQGPQNVGARLQRKGPPRLHLHTHHPLGMSAS